ncbi:MAG: hypothetical protein ACTS3F_01485, partial [Phycisphaerales bacterium]
PAPPAPAAPADPSTPNPDLHLLATFLARNPNARCPKCLYTLGAIHTDQCPECGLRLQLECGPIPRFSTLWLLCFGILASVLGFALFLLATNVVFNLTLGVSGPADIFESLLEFWPMLVGAAILIPAIILFTKKQRAFDARSRRIRWTIAALIFLSGPALMFFFVSAMNF